MRVAGSVVLALGVLLIAGGARAQHGGDVREHIIRDSIRSHGGYCVCPWQKDHKGRLCGHRSLYSHPGGDTPPQCYAHDIDQDSIDAWLNEHEHPSR
jgi:hypothetical protein